MKKLWKQAFVMKIIPRFVELVQILIFLPERIENLFEVEFPEPLPLSLKKKKIK